MFSQINTASWRLPSQGEFIKRILNVRERIRQLTKEELNYGTTRLKRNNRLSFR